VLGFSLAVCASSQVAAIADPGGNGDTGGGVTVTPTPGLPGYGVGVNDPGSGTTVGSGSHTGTGGGGQSIDPCTYTPADPPPPPSTPVGSEYTRYGGSVVYQTCPDGSGGFIWLPKGKTAPAPPAAIDLARTAYGELHPAAPAPVRYPSGTLKDGRAYTVVQTHMWFSTSPGSWSVRSKKVCAGALCATAVATPTRLIFDPGNGDGSVLCAGPGSTFHRQAGGSWVPGRQPQGCDFQYRKSSYGMPNGEVTSTYTIGWTVTWSATNGQGGTFNDLQTNTTSRFAVAEVQSVVIR
jgi:hypothetical protein